MHAIESLVRQRWLLTAVLGCLPAATGAADLAPASARADEVLDAAAGLAWARCAVGQQWDGQRCTGTAELLDHAQAIAAASARRSTDGREWRLPRATELRQLGRAWVVAQAHRPQPFPAATEGWHWSSTRSVHTGAVNQYDYGNIRRGINEQNVARLAFLHGTAVSVPGGQLDGSVLKRERLPVRLVRTIEDPPARP